MAAPVEEVVIERLGHLGDGIAPGPVFVPRTLPGERVRGQRDGDRLTGAKIVEPAPERVAPPCPHYRRCGGCALQHASDAFVANWKTGVVRAALEARGLAAPLRRLHVSPPASRRRATFAGRRTKSGALVGFHARASEIVTPVPECRVVLPEIAALLPALEALVAAEASRKGTLRLAVTATETGADVAVAGGGDADASRIERLGDWARAADVARLTWNGEPVAVTRPPRVRFGAAAVEPPPGAFLQATALGEAALWASVDEATGTGPGPVTDLFAGCGTFALRLARTREVHAVEGDAPLARALDAGWRRTPGLHRVATETRDIFRRPLEGDELRRFSAAVIDPPRAGAEAQIRALAGTGVPRIAALSCNPVSFARDAAILVDGGYALDWVDVVDQFRWSPHIELAALFRRA